MIVLVRFIRIMNTMKKGKFGIVLKDKMSVKKRGGFLSAIIYFNEKEGGKKT